MGRLAQVPPAGDRPSASERAEAKRRLLAPPDGDATPAVPPHHPRNEATSLVAPRESHAKHPALTGDTVTFGSVPDDEFSRDWYPPEERTSVRHRLARLRTWTGRHLRRVLVVAAALVVVAALGVWLVVRDKGPAPLTADDVNQAVAKAIDAEQKRQAAQASDGSVVYAAIRQSLVVISTSRGSASGLGAGTIVKDDGTILTALHVVNGATSITISFADGTQSSATVASATPAQDIAVLTPATLPETVVPAVLGGGVTVGDEVFAVGHPMGYTGSVSGGVVSATNRTVTVQGTQLTGLIQTDAAINPGNSGGPLLNKAGQVVGVVTALANPADEDAYAGIGFAVPIATAGGAAGAPAK